jgi:uncharacterized OB-fold protein
MATPARLDGGACADCGVVLYPYQEGCPRCGALAVRPAALSGTGRLWTWTVQRYPPKSPPYRPAPEGFAPFAVGYVELPEGVRVEGVIEVGDFDRLHIGMPASLATVVGVPHFRVDTDE